MKQITVSIWIGLYIICSFSCIAQSNISKKLNYPQIGYINPVPIERHDSVIPVFFRGEKPKNKSYIKVATLEVTSSESTTYGSMIRQLREKAKHIGADGVFILGKKYTNEYVVNEYNETAYYVYQKHVSAVAIKYIKNIKTYQNYPKRETYYHYDTQKEKYQYYLTNFLDMKGDIEEIEKQNTFKGTVHNFSLQFLLKEENWKWKYTVRKRSVYNRFYYDSRTRSYVRYQINYDSLNRIVQILNSSNDMNIKLIYNDANQVVQKKIYGQRYTYRNTKEGKEKLVRVNHGLKRIETLKYDSINRLIEKEIVTISNRGEEIPWVKVIYSDFYTKKDLMDLSNDKHVE